MIRLLLSLLLPLAFSFSPLNCTATQFIIPGSANITPGTAKSEEIIQKTAPRLKEQFDKKRLIYGAPIFIRIFKKSHELELWVKNAEKFHLFKTYLICDLSGTLGPKVKEGDRQAPEGFYSVAADQLNPRSKHHLSFNLGFPNDYDLAYQRTGSGLMVHGKCNSLGCFAMTNSRIEEIYTIADSALLHGQESFPVHIFPFRMTEDNLNKYSGRWTPFWKNLKEGYDFFQKFSVPPHISVENCRYTFSHEPYQAEIPEPQYQQICMEY